MGSGDCLSSFHPLVREWFLSRYGGPSPVQARVWPRVASGENVLALAPTGSGKTLAAFLDALSRLAGGELPAGSLAVIYVSPLKALNEDVRRNLELPLAGIAGLFEERGLPFPEIRVDVRSGDTPEAERRRFLSRPPAILCTTPESLAILLDSPRARPVLSTVRLLILDEIHSVAGGKRGSLLACSVGRLALLAGEFQRVALSATLRPPELAADFAGGRRLSRDAEGRPSYARRPFAIVAPPGEREVELTVAWPKAPLPAVPAREGASPGLDEGRYAALIPELASRIGAAGNLLVFTDSRRRAERIAYLLNEEGGPGTAYAHHGSLAKEARRLVEERFKAGELHCVVATASLELGIDVGGVGEVALAGSPTEVSTALQRVGRSRHEVGGCSRGIVYPFHGMDLLLSAALVRGVDERAIEALSPPRNPLDILAQVILEMTAERAWDVDELYDTLRSFFPFESLPRASFDATLAMLAGKYAREAEPAARAPGGGAAILPPARGSRLRELEPRLYLDAATGTARAREGVRILLYSSGGSIPDRGHYALRVAGSKAAIGELDEEFVWERKVGEAFTLGLQSWRIVSIGPEAVEVLPLGARDDFIPFWHAEARFRSPEVSRRLLELLDRMGSIPAEEGERLLEAEYHFDEAAARAAASFVAAQREASRGVLPGLSTIAVESYADPRRKGDSTCVVLHSLRGGAINEPLGLLIGAACEEAGGSPPETLSSDDSILLVFDSGSVGPDPEPALRSLLSGLSARGRAEALLSRKLAATGLFGAQFRENSGRALLLPRGLPGKRVPLWVTRLRAKRLFDAVSDFEDFPITAETFRSCLEDFYDLPGLSDLLADIAAGRVGLSFFRTASPSPFARETFWRETGEHMYEGDSLRGRPGAAAGPSIVAEVLRSSRLRPRLDEGLVADFVRKTKRLLPGWGPTEPLELAEWVRERVLVPEAEMAELLASGEPGLAASYAADQSAGGRLERITLPGAAEAAIVHAERRAEIEADPGAFLAEWLRREGPVRLGRVEALFGLGREALCELVSGLEGQGLVVAGFFLKGDREESDEGTELIDAENLEALLRLARKKARWSGEARPGRELFSLVARLQSLGPYGAAAPGAAPPTATEARIAPARPSERRAHLAAALDSLSGLALPPELWEEEILPARLPGYERLDLDSLLEAEPRIWYGAEKGRVAFCLPEELEALSAGQPGKAALLSPDEGPLGFWEIKARLGLSAKEAARAIWKAAFSGSVSAFGFEAVRSGLANGFGKDLPELDAAGEGAAGQAATAPFGAPRRIPRALKEGWKRGAPVAGAWFSLEPEGPEAERDAIDEAELAAARVRMAAARWGLLCRPILAREAPLLSWASLFPALRRLELQGELVYGRFFEDIEGPQFMSLKAFELYRAGLDLASGPAGAEAIAWLNAMDPALDALAALSERPESAGPESALCGPGLALPIRVPGSRVAVQGGRPVAVSTRNFSSLEICLPPESEAAASALRGLAALKERRPGRRIAVDLVNGAEASGSPYAPALEAAGFERDRKRMVLW